MLPPPLVRGHVYRTLRSWGNHPKGSLCRVRRSGDRIVMHFLDGTHLSVSGRKYSLPGVETPQPKPSKEAQWVVKTYLLALDNSGQFTESIGQVTTELTENLLMSLFTWKDKEPEQAAAAEEPQELPKESSE